MIDLRNYALLGLGVALAAALAWGGVQTVRLSNEREAHADTRAAYSEAGRVAAAARAKESETNRTEEARREAAKQKEITHAQEQRRAAVAAAARADRAADGLRDQLATFVSAARARAATPDPGPAGGSPPAGSDLDLLAELYRRADARSGELAKALDVSRAAGLTCERLYEALTAAP